MWYLTNRGFQERSPQCKSSGKREGEKGRVAGSESEQGAIMPVQWSRKWRIPIATELWGDPNSPRAKTYMWSREAAAFELPLPGRVTIPSAPATT